jgi:hypothetical protein
MTDRLQAEFALFAKAVPGFHANLGTERWVSGGYIGLYSRWTIDNTENRAVHRRDAADPDSVLVEIV